MNRLFSFLLEVHIGPPIMMTIESRMPNKFEHIVQSLYNCLYFRVRS
jgi:hypothetical protein